MNPFCVGKETTGKQRGITGAVVGYAFRKVLCLTVNSYYPVVSFSLILVFQIFNFEEKWPYLAKRTQ